MEISIDTGLLAVILIGFIAWVFIHFGVEPKSRNRLKTAHRNSLVDAGANLATLSVIKQIAAAIAIAGSLVIAGTIVLQHSLSETVPTAENISKIVAIRDVLQEWIDWVRSYSLQIWIAALVVLAVIWLLTTRRGSKRRWNEAITARERALTAAVEYVTGRALRSRAREVDGGAVDSLNKRVTEIRKENKERLAALTSVELFGLGEDQDVKYSLVELREIEEQIRADAQKAAKKKGQRKTTSSDDQAPSIDVADELKRQIDQLETELTVELETLESPISCTLAAAAADPSGAAGLATQIERQLRGLIVDKQLADHHISAGSRAQKEPELLQEWVAAGATSEVTVNTTGWAGRLGARVAVIAILLGYVGIGAQQVGPQLIDRAMALEVGLNSQLASKELRNQLEASGSDDDIQDETELASDEATVEQLQQAFRSSVARTLMARSGGLALSRQQRFRLAAVEARQRIVSASARSAAPSLEVGRNAQVIEPHLPKPPPAAIEMQQSLDRSMQRRIEVLRSNPGTWRKLRASAARTAPPDFVAKQFFRTAFTGDTNFVRSHFMRMWADRASADFSKSVAKTGKISGGHVISGGLNDIPELLSQRERRLVNDFKRQAPQRVSSTLTNFENGRTDPGSLHRTIPGSQARAASGSVGGAARAGSAYAELFPAADAIPPGSPNETRKPRSSGRVRTAARSYTRIRFSGRVGGVVIGRKPEESDVNLNVTSFDWKLNQSGQVQIQLGEKDNPPVAIGSFHPAIAHAALAYAADGRVVTSTLPQPTNPQSGSGGHQINVQARRVAVHPAFEDTAFACPAIQVDRFVDAFTGDQSLPNVSEIKSARLAVSSLGTVLQYTELAGDPRYTDVLGERLDLVSAHARTCGIGTNCFPVEIYETYGFDFGNPASLMRCVKDASKGSECLSALASMYPKSSFLVDSGVREIKFSLDHNFSFLTGSGEEPNSLWPLDFMIQAVPQQLRGGDVEVSSGWEPWRFPSIDKQIHATVARGVQSNKNAKAVLTHMREFVVLQRLFRLALEGSLGFEFPLSKLADLQAETATFVKVRRHERWNVNNELYQVLLQQQAGIVSDLESMRGSSSVNGACSKFLSRALSAHKNESWPSQGKGFWPFIGEGPKRCSSYLGESLRDRIRELRRLDLIEEAIYIATRKEGEGGNFACKPL